VPPELNLYESALAFPPASIPGRIRIMRRPIATVVLTVLAAVAGVVAAFDVLRYLHILPFMTVGGVNFYSFSLFGALLAGIVALIWFWAAGRLWVLDPQGWQFVVAVAIIYLVFDFIAVLAGTPWDSLLPSIVLSVAVLGLAALPGTRRAYEQPRV
jgi:hypothetical protein